ncbi:winged helix-turn-helix domain-containing protein [Levilactobacillus brevis]|uniref:ArsR/SmtB family transcription factor n=1 Tax=Levilactobacillus brevis TaxID=1580 RepID=UPI0021A751F9|nr:winged helix-turn-helix domain-containing protein [Levilactobacillus brevis]MCT2885895.1 ArsR family transcriptional regulator [Levilactobacillus brevis]
MVGKQQVDPQQQLKVFKALADPVRLKIVHYLKQLDHEVACGEVQQAIQISKTSGTYHFKLLQNAGLITARKEAREKYVQLNPVVFQTYVTDFFADRQR